MTGFPCFLCPRAVVEQEFEERWEEFWDMAGTHVNRFYLFCRWVEREYGEDTPMSRKGLIFALTKIVKDWREPNGKPTADRECERGDRKTDC